MRIVKIDSLLLRNGSKIYSSNSLVVGIAVADTKHSNIITNKNITRIIQVYKCDCNSDA